MRRCWWVVPALAAWIGLLWLTWVYPYPPLSETISFMLERPRFADCTTEVKHEGALPSGRFRITEHVWAPSGRSMYIVFLLPADSPLAKPLLNSVDLPVPREVREHDARRFEIVLAAALPDGTDRLPVMLDAAGSRSTCTTSSLGIRRKTDLSKAGLRPLTTLRK